MDMKQLRYFVTIVEQGSISAAARKLYMSQPPISYQIKLLEQELECSLFERTTKTISLTAQGKLLYERATAILSLLQSTENQVKEIEKDQCIRIGIVSSLIDFLCDKIAVFHHLYPEVRFEITEGNTYQLLEALQQGLVMMVIVRKPYGETNFIQQKLMDDHLVAIGSGLEQEVHLADLASQPLIVYRRWLEVIEKQFSVHHLVLPKFIVNDDARTTLALAKRGLGIALVPKSCTMSNDLPVSEIVDSELSSEVFLVSKEMLKEADLAFSKIVLDVGK